MFISRKRFKEIENRLIELESLSKAQTFYYGELNLQKLARIVEIHCRQEKARPPAATDGREG